VKFKEVSDIEVEILSKKLADVWWEKYKLRINRARFGKEDKKFGSASDNNQSPRLLLENDRQVSKDLSFKSLLLGKEGNAGPIVDKDGMVVDGDGGRKKIRALSVCDLVPLEIPVHEASLKKLKQCVVGFFKETMDIQTFNERLMLEGQHEVKATFMGGNMVLLSCPSEGELEEVRKLNKKWWDNCFLKVIPWRPSLVSECRET
jgi:hypothetical protein